jgi:predicted nucleotide-binding protein
MEQNNGTKTRLAETMAGRKRTPTSENQGPTMDSASAIAALQKQKQRGLEIASDASSDATTRSGWHNTTRAILAAAFGPESRNIGAVSSAGPHHHFYTDRTPDSVMEAHARTNLRASATMLDSCIEQLELLAPPSAAAAHALEGGVQPAQAGRSVFIVHGWDEGKKEAVARFLSKLDLEPIILHEQANQGRTLIEKFEAHADVSFAIVILTGDDKGGPIDSDSLHPRGRQNVVFELGYFFGRLGRKGVCTLYEEGVEIPSDFSGIVYIPLDAAGAWRTLLARELKAAGLEIDMNRAF